MEHLKRKLQLCNVIQNILTFRRCKFKSYADIQKKFNIDVGYSDHTLGIDASLWATAMGAKVIEKHITLNSSFVGPDHKASIEEEDLKI